MAEIDDRIRAVQTQRAQALNLRARHEVEKENAEKAVREARASLEEEFGVKTGDQLRAKKAELDKALEDAVAEAEAQLQAASA